MSIEKIELKGIGRIKFYVMHGDEQVSSFIEIMSVFVNDEFRRKGHGSTLIRRLIDEAKKRKINAIYVKANKDSQQGFKKFLKHNGFNPSPKKMLFQRHTRSLTYRVAKFMKRRLHEKWQAVVGEKND